MNIWPDLEHRHNSIALTHTEMLIVLGSSVIKGQTSVLRAQSFNDATADTVAVTRFHWGFASTKSSSICHLWTVPLALSRKCSVLDG